MAIKQSITYTGIEEDFPSINAFYNQITTSIDKLIENTDFSTGLTNSNPYTYNTIDGDIKIENAPALSNTNRVNAQLINPLINEFSFKKGDIGRTFIVLGYNSPTQICVAFLSWNTGSIFAKVSNYNLTNATATQIIASTTANMTNNQIGKVKVIGDSIEFYKDTTLISTLNYANILSLGGWVNNRCLGFGFHSYGTTGTATVTNANYILKEVFLKGETTTTQQLIFPKISNELSSYNTWSSQDIFKYLNANLQNLKVSILGDSHSDVSSNYGGCLPQDKWWNILRNRHNWSVLNKSAGGRSLAEVQGESSATDLALLDSLDENGTPDLIIVMLGTNDFAGDNVPLGNPTDTVKTTFWGASNFVFNYLKERYQRSKIVYVTPPQIGSTLFVTDSTQTRIGTGIKFIDYIKAPKVVCNNLGIDVLEFHEYAKDLNYEAIMSDNSVSSDKLHFTGYGNYLQAMIKERQLRRLLPF